jgi:hypothetical protein
MAFQALAMVLRIENNSHQDHTVICPEFTLSDWTLALETSLTRGRI